MADGAFSATTSALVLRAARTDDPKALVERLLLSSLTDAIFVGGVIIGLGAALTSSSWELVAASWVVGVAPFLFAIAVLGRANVIVPYATVCCASIALMLGAYAMCEATTRSVAPLPLALICLCLALAVAPQFVALWASTRTKLSDVRQSRLPCDAIGLVSVTSLLVVSLVTVASLMTQNLLNPFALTALYVGCMIPPVLVNWLQARRDGRVPVRRGDKQPDHISGLGASTFILFAIVVITLGLWAATAGTQATISTYAGLIVLIGLMLAFAIVAFGLPQARVLSWAYHSLKGVSKPVGWLFSTIDSLLVYAVANALGANSPHWPTRFVLLLGSLAPCAILGWWLPAPFGLIPLALALIGSISIARRWAWMEEDRENAMLARKFEGDHIRVGFAQDLKDEALVGFAVLFLIVPIGLRQLHLALSGQAFEIEPIADQDNLFAWLSFFGTEMAKAVPFVDWTEIYRINGSSSISLSNEDVGAGQHVVFGMRILVDLVLLAAFLQAISIMQRTKKLKEMFYVEQSMNRLDPFIEPGEFRKLVSHSETGLRLKQAEFDAFPVYDPDRLEELKQRGDRDEVGFVAAQLLDRDERGGPEEQLSREARRTKPDLQRCQALIVEVTDLPAAFIQVGPLKAAHFALNARAAALPIRTDITANIIRAPSSQERINALSEILIGPGPGVQDPRKEVRRIALNALYQPAIEGNAVARGSIERAATHDPAKVIREIAADMVVHNSDW